MDNEKLSAAELDALRKAMGIGYDAAATTVTEMLDAKARIAAQQITVCPLGEVPLAELEPAFGIEIEYSEGLKGKNCLLLKQSDVQSIVCRMMGTPVESDFVLDEMSESCIREFMSQMMGGSVTALAGALKRAINIAMPLPFEVQGVGSLSQQCFASGDETVVLVRLAFVLEGVLDSLFLQVMPLSLAKTMAAPLLPAPAPAAAPSAGKAAAAPAAPVQARQSAPAPAANPGARPAAAQKAAAAPQAQTVQEPKGLDMLLDVPLKATVEVGRTRRKVADVLTYGKGDVIVLEQGTDEPVDLFVDGVLVAKGSIVVVDGNFGFRVDKVCSRPRLRPDPSMGGRPV